MVIDVELMNCYFWEIQIVLMQGFVKKENMIEGYGEVNLNNVMFNWQIFGKMNNKLN